jgi:hypothetical protein
MSKVIWDLCSGLGGASEAFLANGWDVLRVENNPALEHVPNTLMIDLKSFYEDIDFWVQTMPPTIIWASPPCNEWSDGFNSKKAKMRRAGETYEPDLQLFKLCEKIIHQVNPEYHVIENVRGAREFFNPIIGEPAQQINGIYLWGNFPFIALPAGFKHRKVSKKFDMHDPLRANKRAKIPYEVSLGLLRGLTEQKKLGDWI